MIFKRCLHEFVNFSTIGKGEHTKVNYYSFVQTLANFES